MTAPRSLHHWSQRVLAEEARKIEAALAARCSQWGLAPDAAGLAVGLDNAPEMLGQPDLAGLAWQACEGNTPAWVSLSETLPDALAHGLFGEAQDEARLARALAQNMAADLVSTLLQTLALPGVGERATPPADLFQRWSGAVVVRVAICGVVLTLLIAAEPARRLLRRERKAAAREALTPLIDALPIVLNARLQPFALPIAKLQSLAAGDVLRLPHRLDEALQLCASGVAPLAGWLGEKDGHRALVLSPQKSEAQS
ncbi:MAG: hypothetical protein RIR70_1443 [Pseudomonadota bacterium]